MVRRFDWPVLADSTSNGAAAAAGTAFAPNRQFIVPRIQEALEHLASIDLIELCNEAKVERCRATRDLRSCGRKVESVLTSCGHASLCTECCQRCDICPICRIPIPKSSNGLRLRLRLYYECIEAGLISKKCDDRFQEKDVGEGQTEDIERLYALFDVALGNNLVFLICHYVTDVCMDESAVSSDPVIAFLLDEVVVKDWCKRTFREILEKLQDLYKLTVQQMKKELISLCEFSVKLAGLSNVLEVLESSFKGSHSAQLYDVQVLQESILKTKQHTEIMIWCIRHNFLDYVCSRYTNFKSWRACVRERKSAAVKRSWPDSVNHSAQSIGTNGSTLFIEDALSNIEIDQGYSPEMEGEYEITSLQKDRSSSFFRSKIEGMAGCYPFENLRAAADVLFLHGSSDMVVAKKAIFLYYLFDRHWTGHEEEWKRIVDDFAATFNITRHFLLESFVFYLLDDDSENALQEARRLLPEIAGSSTHPKVAQVLLERQNPDDALMVLRWSGRDGATQLVTFGEAVTGVRVRVECGLMTEAFMYQRKLCLKVKENKLKHGLVSSDIADEKSTNWLDWVEALVTEICCLCIRRNLVDRMIELPWNIVEEKYIHKSLLDFAAEDPSTTTGSLLVVFYLQRYRYVEAYQVDRRLQTLEEDFISKNSVPEDVLFRMRSASHWRAGLVEKSIDLLPQVQQQQARSGKLAEGSEVENPVRSDTVEVEKPSSATSLLFPASFDSRMGKAVSSSSLEAPANFGGFAGNSKFELGRNQGALSSSILQGSFLAQGERGLKPQTGLGKNLKFGGTGGFSPLKELNRSSLRRGPHQSSSSSQKDIFDQMSPEKVQKNGFTPPKHEYSSPYSLRSRAEPTAASLNDAILPKKSSTGGSVSHVNAPTPTQRMQLDEPDTTWKVAPSSDPMDLSWSHGEKAVAEDGRVKSGLRWRSDDASEDEEAQSFDRVKGTSSNAAATPSPRTTVRRSSRLAAKR